MQMGIDILQKKPELMNQWGRVGLVINQASVAKNYAPTWKIVYDQIGKNLVALFGPQHGLESAVQENMIETPHDIHIATGLPAYSLYSETREPTAEMLKSIDTLVFDLPITGCRIYTYKYTLAGVLRAAKKHQKKVVILDRMNPIGGCWVEGNCLDPETASFVGEFPIPMRHGLTMAEAGLLFNKKIGAEVETIKLESWDPLRYWEQYQRDWVLTSPNLQSFDACAVFPGMVMLEGTNVSEGRGTTLPFQLIGAPYIMRGDQLVERILELYGPSHDAFVLRPTSFLPAFHKHQNEICQGLQIHVVDAKKLASYRLGLAVLRAFIELGGEKFKWREPPYEYEYKMLPIEILMGSKTLPHQLRDAKFDINASCWNQNAAQYIEHVQTFLLYPRKMKI